MSSSRLPGKPLTPLLGRPLLARLIERVTRARLIDRIVIATTGQPIDDEIARLANDLRIDCYRGAVDDLLDRYYQCAKRYNADHIVRLMGDAPLIDPDIIDLAIRRHLSGQYDFTTNVAPPTYPDGQNVEVASRAALLHTWEHAIQPAERVDWSQYILANRKAFSIGVLTNHVDHSMQRWTVDEAEDLRFVRAVYEALYPANPRFSSSDILDYLSDHPELTAINSHLAQDHNCKPKLDGDSAAAMS